MEGVFDVRTRRVESAARIHLLARGALDRAQSRADRLANRLVAQAPNARLARLRAQLERAGPRLAAAMSAALDARVRRVERVTPRLAIAGRRGLDQRVQRIALAARALDSISPFRVLERGYSITRKSSDGSAVRSGAEIAPGDAIETLFAAGSAISRVETSRASRPGEMDV